MKTIHIDLFRPSSVDAAIQELQDYKSWITKKAKEIARRLADIGAVNVSLEYSRSAYVGQKDVQITVEQIKPDTYAIEASGETVLFLEFGAGIRYGYGHPNPTLDGIKMGPGTYPSDKGHWDNPRGWYIPGGKHTYGNPPSAAMYITGKELRNRIEDVAREVFRS